MNDGQQKVLDREVAELSRHPPFDRVSAQALAGVLGAARLHFFARGSDVAHPDAGLLHTRLLVLKSGRVAVRQPAPAGCLTSETLRVLAPGAIFPATALLDDHRPRHVFHALDDCFCWALEGDAARRLLAQAGVVQALLATESGIQDALDRRHGADYEARRVAEQVLCLTLQSVVKRTPVSVPPHTPTAEALKLMAKEGIGSLVVAEGRRPAGIVTASDLLKRVIAADADPATPLAGIMSAPVFSLRASATVGEATLEMGARAIRHIVVVNDENELTGVVSERDLFGLQRLGLRQLSEPIDAAASVADLQRASERIREVGRAMLQQGMDAAPLTSLISSFNDRITARLIGLLRRDALRAVEFCWLAFGSEGREEQTFSTDQDNGLLFSSAGSGDIENTRAALLELAAGVNNTLARCGFPLCEGGIMAMNPKWCLSAEEWRRRFSGWINTPAPEALLNASIFFDFRPLYGNFALAEELRDHLFRLSRDNTIFLNMMVRNAIEVTVPLGLFARFATASGEHAGTIDIKKQGARIFVDVARILALAHGVRATNTAQRLRLGGQRIKRRAQAVEADIDAFHFIQGLRLRLPEGKPHVEANRIDPDSLNEFDQRMLKEALRQAQLLQERLKLDYSQ